MDSPFLASLLPFADLEAYDKRAEVKSAFVFCLMKCHKGKQSGQESATVAAGVMAPLESACLQSSTLQKTASFASVSVQWIF